MKHQGGEFSALCMGVVPAASRWHSALERLNDKAHHQWLELGSAPTKASGTKTGMAAHS